MRQVEAGMQTGPGQSARSDLTVVVAQLRGVDTLTQAWRAAQDAARVCPSREARMDAERRLAVRRRMQDALIARTHEQLQATGQSRADTTGRTAVLVHRSPWFTRSLARTLEQGGCQVAGQLVNGADAVGVAAAEQPAVVLVEDRLVMLAGEQVVREVRRWCPETVIAAQVSHSAMASRMVQAGASTVLSRLTPPAQVAASMLALLSLPA